jgi:hypothetical protein
MLKEYLSEAVSLLAEAILGRPVKSQAASCRKKFGAPLCDWGFNCGYCGTMKRQYQQECWLFNYCGQGWQWCDYGCLCDYC